MTTQPKDAPKTPEQMSGAELEEAIRQHLETAQRLLREVQERREAEKANKTL